MNTIKVGSMHRKIFAKPPTVASLPPEPVAWIIGRTPLGWHQLVAMA